ncbi:MAG: DNA polymerase III subunit epsilon [Flavobacteriaceae bacterium]|nr:DNA polymerase III subunit epsilon [Flavobacteriaceae bacterium]
MYAILDIETTGGKYNEEGITEIAIYKYDGHQVVDQLITLVNPEREIQPFVVNLTGINSGMLINAPKFHEIAKRIVEMTQDCVVVAHNSSFDYRILKTEFRRLGFDFQRETLCTVALTKKLIPDLDSYSLGKLCKKLCIPVSNRHRAEGDALATVKLFKLLIDKDSEKTIIKSHIKNGIEKELPSKFQKILDNLPSNTGLFYAHQNDGEILYIGKGKNIKKSVNKIFLKTSKKAKLLQSSLTSVSHELSGNELINMLKFHKEILQNKPKFNLYYPKKVDEITFSNSNLIVVDKGRTIGEKSIILIENDVLLGFCFVDLEYQINNLEILKSLISPLENSKYNRFSIKNYLEKYKVGKIIRF